MRLIVREVLAVVAFCLLAEEDLIQILKLFLDLGVISFFLQLLKDVFEGELNFAFMGMLKVSFAEEEATDLDGDDDDCSEGDADNQSDIEIAGVCAFVEDVACFAGGTALDPG